MTKKALHTDHAPAAIGPYSQAIRAGDFLYASGQIPIDPSTGNIPEGIEAQTRQVFENIKAILSAAGGKLDSIVKTTVFLQDMNHFAAMNEIYAETFDGCVFPARSAVQVARLPKDVLIEIEIIAMLA